jgi:uncharacterized Zn-finger protein
LDAFQSYRDRCIESNRTLNEVKNEIDDPSYYPCGTLNIEILNTDSVVKPDSEGVSTKTLLRSGKKRTSPKPIAKKTNSKTSTKTPQNANTRKIKFEVNENGQYKCNLCPREFLNLELLRKHVRVHQRKKSLICDDCGRVLSGTQSLKVSLTDF